MDEKSLPLLIFVNKGIEIGTQALTLEIIADTCGSEFARVATFIVSVDQQVTQTGIDYISIQSGPSFAKESKPIHLLVASTLTNLILPVVRRQPTSVSVASLSEDHARRASQVFHQPWFRWSVISMHSLNYLICYRLT